MCNTVLSTFNSCDPHASLTHTACCCMVVLSGTSLADSFLHWRFPSKIFSGEFGGSHEIATLKVCIKLHILTVFLIALYAYLTTLQERPVSQTPICFMTPYSIQHQCVHSSWQQSLLCSQIHDIAGTLRKTLFVLTLQDT